MQNYKIVSSFLLTGLLLTQTTSNAIASPWFSEWLSSGTAGSSRVYPMDIVTVVANSNVDSVKWHRSIQYNWQVRKTTTYPNCGVTLGQKSDMPFDIQAVRAITGWQDNHSVEGRICLINEGSYWTRTFKIVAGIQQDTGSGAFNDVLDTQKLITSYHGVAPGENDCFNYSSNTTLSLKTDHYRLHATICFGNSSSDSGVNSTEEAESMNNCITADSPFTLPDQVTSTEKDKTASLVNVTQCPTGFGCELPVVDQTLDRSFHEIPFTGKVWLTSESCTPTPVNNFVSLTQQDTQTIHTDTSSMELVCHPTFSRPTGPTSPPSPLPPPMTATCTQNIDYWKNHAGFNGQPDRISSLLPISLGKGSGTAIVIRSAAHAVALLNEAYCSDAPGNGIGNLYAQLLGVYLNSAANGADTQMISETIANADSYLMRHDCTDWHQLPAQEQSQIMGWQNILENYNSGLIGPDRCPQ